MPHTTTLRIANPTINNPTLPSGENSTPKILLIMNAPEMFYIARHCKGKTFAMLVMLDV
jgi:hypothetical protein